MANNTLVAIGDSITAGAGLAQPYTALLTLTGSWTISNDGIFGLALTDALAYGYAQQHYFGTFVPGTGNVAVVWLGTNDLANGASAATAYANLLLLCQLLQNVGYKVIVCTCLDRTGLSTAAKNAFNNLILGTPSAFQGIVDFTSTPLGIDGGASSTTWFQDGLHPTQLGQTVHEVPLISAAVNAVNLSPYAHALFTTKQFYSTHNAGLSLAYPAQNDSGAVLVGAVFGQGVSPTGMSDTANGVWQQAGSYLNVPSGLTVGFFYRTGAAAGPNTVTATLAGSSANLGMALLEYLPPSNSTAAFDAESQGLGTTSITIPNLTTSLDHDLLVAIILQSNFGGSMNPGSGFTLRISGRDAFTSEDSIAGAAGSYGASATGITNSPSGGGLLAFKALLSDFADAFIM